MNKEECILFDRQCIECGQCEVCDLDSSKVCDSCMKCIQSDADYRAIIIDEVEEVIPSKDQDL